MYNFHDALLICYNGSFSETVCSNLTSLAHLSLSTDAVHVDAFVIARCLGNRRFIDGKSSKALTCMPSGEWSEVISDCTGERLVL